MTSLQRRCGALGSGSRSVGGPLESVASLAIRPVGGCLLRCSSCHIAPLRLAGNGFEPFAGVSMGFAWLCWALVGFGLNSLRLLGVPRFCSLARLLSFPLLLPRLRLGFVLLLLLRPAWHASFDAALLLASRRCRRRGVPPLGAGISWPLAVGRLALPGVLGVSEREGRGSRSGGSSARQGA